MKSNIYGGIISIVICLCMVSMLPTSSGAGANILPDPVVVKYLPNNRPVIDGDISSGEYNNATFIRFGVNTWCGGYSDHMWHTNATMPNSTVYIYTMRDKTRMYIAIDNVWDITMNASDYMDFGVNYDSNSFFDIWLDTGDFEVKSTPSHTSHDGSGTGADVEFGFGKTNKSDGNHRIMEINTSVENLPPAGSYFSVVIGYLGYECSSGNSIGWGYPPEAWNMTAYNLTIDNASVNHHKWADWVLEAVPPHVPNPVDDFAPAIGYLLIGTIAATCMVFVLRDEYFIWNPEVGAVIILGSFIGLLLGYSAGWFRF